MAKIKITTRRVLDEFRRRQIPIEQVFNSPFLLHRYYHDGAWHLLRSTMPEYTSVTGIAVCAQKHITSEFAQRNGIPVPESLQVAEDGSNQEAVDAFVAKYPYSVVKPGDAAHGKGITIGATKDSLDQAVATAFEASKRRQVLLQQYVEGSDLRVLTIGGKFAASVRRVPASVEGDGERNIRQLIEYVNATSIDRGTNDEKRFSKIDTVAAERFLGAELDDRIPAKGEWVTVVGTANIGSGGYAVDYTDKVPDAIKRDAEKFSQLTAVAACGVDFIWNESTGKYYFIEANVCPGFNLHIQPSEGKSRPVDRYFLDFLLAQKGAGSWRPFEFAE